MSDIVTLHESNAGHFFIVQDSAPWCTSRRQQTHGQALQSVAAHQRLLSQAATIASMVGQRPDERHGRPCRRHTQHSPVQTRLTKNCAVVAEAVET
jgi:hypothetical protein